MNARALAVGLAMVTVLSGLLVVSGSAPGGPTHPGVPASTSRFGAVPVPQAIVAPDPGWQTPLPLETQTTADANLVGVALSADGSGMVVWQRGGPRSTLMATHFLRNGGGDAGTNWQVPVQISDSVNSIGYAYRSAVGMDASGDALAVYYAWNGDGHGYTIYAAYFQHGVGWRAPVAIDQPFDWSYYPAVAMNAFGDAVVVWEVYTGSTYNIYSNHYVPGSGWGTAGLISNASNASYSPTVAIDGAGNAIAAWYEFGGGTEHVFATRYATLSGWAAPIWTGTSANYSFSPSVAMDPEGNGIVSWIEWDGQYNIWAKLYVNTSGWATATNIEASPYSAAYSPGPAVAINKGNAAVVWTMSDATGTANVFVNRYVSGTGWVGEVDVDGTSSPAQAGIVAIDPTGNVTIAYEYTPTGASPPNQIVDMAAHFDHVTSSWSFSQLDYERAGSGSPLVAIDGKGNALAVWNYNENSDPTTPSRNGLLTNYYTSGTGWQPYYQAQRAEWDDQLQPSWLQLESNARGDAIFSFTQDDGPIWHGYAVLRTPGSGWGPVTRIEEMTHSSVAEEWSAIDGSGNAIVLFKTSDGAQYNVYATYHPVGGGWGAPVRIDNAVGSDKYWLRVAMNREGNGVAAWQEYNGTNWNAYAAFFNGTTQTWSAPTEVQSTYTYLGSVVVGIDGRGDSLTVYQAWNGSAYNNYASLYRVGSGWGAPVQISTSGVSSGVAYALAMNEAGDAAASWGQTNGNRSVAAVTTYNPTTGWGADTAFISAPGDEGPATPSLDGSGDTLLAYDAWTGSQWVAYAVTKPASGAWGTPVQISSGSGDASGVTSVLDERGSGYVAWTQFNGIGNDIVARRYVTGLGWGPAAIVNQPAPATSATNSGSALLGTDGRGDAFLGWNQWNNAALLPYAAEYVVGNVTPSLSVTSPANGTLTNRSSVTVAGATDPGTSVTINAVGVPVAPDGSFASTYSLADGAHGFVVVATSATGDRTSVTVSVTVDTVAPALAFTSPPDGTTVAEPSVVVTGTTDAGSNLVVNGYAVAVTRSGAFSVLLALRPGNNTVTATATDPAGNSASRAITVTYHAPEAATTSSSSTPTPTLALLFGLVAVAIVLGVASLVVRSRKPPGPMGPPKELPPVSPPEVPPK